MDRLYPRNLPIAPPHMPRTEAEHRADEQGRPVRWRGRMVYPANRPGLPGRR